MYSRLKVGMVVLAAVMALGLFAQAEASKHGGKNKAGKVEGVLTAVAIDSVSIRTRQGVDVVLIVNAATKVEANKVHVPVTSLPVGARAQAVFDPATLIASKVEAKF